MASSRIQRWAIKLSCYQYTIRYKTGKTLSNADAFSRLPRSITTSSDCLPGDLVHLVDHLSTTTISCSNIKAWTDSDPVLSKVRRYIQTGWVDGEQGEEFKPVRKRQKELSVLDGCLLWGSRVIVPPQGRDRVLRKLHETHPGASKMKSLARGYLW